MATMIEHNLIQLPPVSSGSEGLAADTEFCALAGGARLHAAFGSVTNCHSTDAFLGRMHAMRAFRLASPEEAGTMPG
jgi:hypothetical protein